MERCLAAETITNRAVCVAYDNMIYIYIYGMVYSNECGITMIFVVRGRNNTEYRSPEALSHRSPSQSVLAYKIWFYLPTVPQ